MIRYPSNPTWSTGDDPTKLAIIRAMDSCQSRLGRVHDFCLDMADAMTQQWVCFLHSYSLEVEEVHY